MYTGKKTVEIASDERTDGPRSQTLTRWLYSVKSLRQSIYKGSSRAEQSAESRSSVSRLSGSLRLCRCCRQGADPRQQCPYRSGCQCGKPEERCHSHSQRDPGSGKAMFPGEEAIADATQKRATKHDTGKNAGIKRLPRHKIVSGELVIRCREFQAVRSRSQRI